MFKDRNLREIANCIIGDNNKFLYKSSSYITKFFNECDLDFVHDGTTRGWWVAERLKELLQDPIPAPNNLSERFIHVLRILMHKSDASDEDPDRSIALDELNKPLKREGYEAFYGEDDLLYIRHVGTKVLSGINNNPHRPYTPEEVKRREKVEDYLRVCSEDDLIEKVLLPLFRELGFHRITAAGHKDKALEYGKDIWMKYVLPTQNILYFGIQVKKGKLDASGISKGTNSNVAEVFNQTNMMLAHEVFDHDTNKRALVDHAYIISGGEITKQARNWLGNALDATKRSQILFLDKDDILNLFTVNRNLQIPENSILSEVDDIDSNDIPF